MRQQRCYGQIYIENEEYKNTIEIYTNALKYRKDDFNIYYILGICYAHINDFPIAKKCLQKTVELNDEMYNAYYHLGQIALLYRDFDSAEYNFSKSIYNEKEAKSYIELAKINILKNQKEKATINLNNAVKIESKYYKQIINEPMFFPIKHSIEKPINENNKEFEENKFENNIEEYLNDTYNLTKVLNKQKDKRNIKDKRKT